MGFYQVMIAKVLLLSWFSISSALDMSIINYNNIGMKETLRSEEEMRWLYEEWLVKFDKSHVVHGEKERRFEIFKDNLQFIDEHNHPRNNHSYVVGLNEFADLTNEEYQAKYLNQWISMKTNFSLERGKKIVAEYKNEEVGQLPAFVDWRTTGAIGPVINQGECASCWAWTATSAVEALHQIQTGDLITLSAQQLVDCDARSHGCSGGWVDRALNYIANNHGIDTHSNYPYKKMNGRCKQNAAKVISIDSSKSVFPFNDEGALQRAVVKQPIGISIEAKGRSFQLYMGGIFNGQCGTLLDHAMLLIGYGTENGQDYWLIKNSYGMYWGEDGFVRMERNIRSRYGQCGLTKDTYYPERRQGP